MATYNNTILVAAQSAPYGPRTLAASDIIQLGIARFRLDDGKELGFGSDATCDWVFSSSSGDLVATGATGAAAGAGGMFPSNEIGAGLSFTAGAGNPGTAGSDGAGTGAKKGGAGGALSWVAGVGGVGVGDADAADKVDGGVGGGLTLTAGAGAVGVSHTSNAAAAGAGGSLDIIAGSGGAGASAGGQQSAAAGLGGTLTLRAGAAGNARAAESETPAAGGTLVLVSGAGSQDPDDSSYEAAAGDILLDSGPGLTYGSFLVGSTSNKPASVQMTVQPNQATAFRFADNSVGYLTITGATGSEDVTFGDGTVITYNFLGTGQTEFDGAVGADGNLRVGSGGASNFSVTAASGNTTVGGTFTSTGAGEFDSTLGADGNLRVGSGGASNFSVTAASGNTTVGGTLAVTGIATFADNVIVQGSRIEIDSTVSLNKDNIIVVSSEPSAAVDGGVLVERYYTAWGTATESGTAQAGGASTITLAAGASAADDNYNNWSVAITGGTGAGQQRLISDYVGATKVATVDRAWDTAPDNTSTYALHQTPDRYVGVLWDESAGLFVAGKTHTDPGAGGVTFEDHLGMRMGGLTVDDNATVGGTLGVTGLTTVTGGLRAPDSALIAAGAGDDLSMTHDGTNSALTNITGHLNIVVATAGGDKDIYLTLDNTTSGSVFRVRSSTPADLFTVDGSGQADFAGNLDANAGLDVTGGAFTVSGQASTFTGVVTVGVDDSGHDVTFYGATSGAYLLWDESADDLRLVGGAGFQLGAGTVFLSDTTDLAASAGAQQIATAAAIKSYVDATSSSGFTAAADSGSSQTISGGDTLTLAGGAGISSVASATDTITFNLDATNSVQTGWTGSSIDFDSAGAITFDGASFTVGGDNDTGAIALTATGAAVTVTGAGINLAGGSSEVDVTTTGALDLNSGAGTWDASTLSIDSTDTTNLSMTGNSAGNLTLTIAASNSGAGAGLISMTADGAMTLTAGAASTWSTSAGALTLTSAAAATWSTSAGALSITGAGGLNLESTSGSMVATLPDNTANAFLVKQGSGAGANNYIAVDTSDSQAVLALGNSVTAPFIDLGGASAGALYKAIVGFTANAAENVTVGDALYITTAGTVGKADADASGKKFVVGIAAETKTSGNATRVASMPGQVVIVNTNLAASSIGDEVYLDKTTAGGLTTTAPSASGDVVYRVGFVHTAAAAGSAKIILAPQFLQAFA